MNEVTFFNKFPQVQYISEDRKEQILERLREAPDWLLKYFVLSIVPPDTAIVREGQPVSYIYYVLSGTIKAIDYRVFGVEFDFAYFTKVYAMGGMEVLMNLKTYRTTLKTVDRCMILKIRTEIFDKWIMTDIHALRYESKMMGEYLLEQGRRAREDLFLPGPERLARLFIRKYKKYSKNGVLRLVITRQALSNETGFTVKTVSRAIKTLSDDGFITKCDEYYQIDEKQYNSLRKLIKNIVAIEENELSI